MPQLDLYIWFFQLFFLVLVFGGFYICASYFFIPSINRTIYFREYKLNYIFTEILSLGKNELNYYKYNLLLNLYNNFYYNSLFLSNLDLLVSFFYIFEEYNIFFNNNNYENFIILSLIDNEI